MKNRVSYFSDGVVCTSLRKLPSYILDFLITLIIQLLLYAVIEGIVDSTSYMREKRADISLAYLDMIHLTNDAFGVDKNSEDYDVFIDSDWYFDDYIHGSVLKRLNEDGYPGISENIYGNYEEVDETNDRMYHYFVVFKSASENKENFYDESVKNVKVGLDYYRSELFKYSSSEYFTSTGYPALTSATALELNSYFLESKSSGEKIYEEIKESYFALIAEAVSELENDYMPYISLSEVYNELGQAVYILRNVELLSSYALAIAISYILFPLVFKDGRTLSMKALRMGAVKKDGTPVMVTNVLLRALIIFLTNWCLVDLTAFIFYGVNGVELILEVLFWNITFFGLGVFSLLYLLLSFLLTFCLRDSRQSISEFISREVVRDANVLKKEEVSNGRKQSSGKRAKHN